jgi:MinD-like ATPase involved in chromosome partitioning or flagellar assembly
MIVKPRPAQPSEPVSLGRVITFYSYKGGTGRSMALANVAWMLALNGKRVLVIDWDLEAPGLHRYFHPFLKDKELLNTQGLLDFVEKQAARAAVSKEREKKAAGGNGTADVLELPNDVPTNDFEPLPPETVAPVEQPPATSRQHSAKDETAIIDYLVPLVWPNETRWQQFGPRARIDLIPAGRQGPAYSRSLSAFNWLDFFERLDGRSVLQTAREQLRRIYDYILIDSRTGVSDTSGICTVEMPDTLVVCFTLNDQSISGASGIAESVVNQRKAREAANPPSRQGERPFTVFPVPMRVDTSEHIKRQVALELVREKFSRFLDERFQRDLSSYWGSAPMAYYPFCAFEEIPSVFGDTPNVDLSLTASVKKITGYLTESATEAAITNLPPLDSDYERAEQKRKEIVSWFERAASPVRLAQAAYDQFEPARQKTMLKVLERLVQVDPKGQDTVRACETEEFPADCHEVINTLTELRVLAVSKGSSGTDVVALSDPVIPQKWEVLRNRIEEDRPFLVWRQTLSVATHSWLTIQRDVSALWRGKLAEEAQRWRDERFDDLNQAEQDFLTQSLEEARKENRMESLETVAMDQRRWSLTATNLKRRIENGRRLVLGLGIAGAVLEALAAQLYNYARGISEPYYSYYFRASEIAGYLGAVALALVVLAKARSLGRERLQGWILARAASESLKREMFYFRTASGPVQPGFRRKSGSHTVPKTRGHSRQS